MSSIMTDIYKANHIYNKSLGEVSIKYRIIDTKPSRKQFSYC